MQLTPRKLFDEDVPNSINGVFGSTSPVRNWKNAKYNWSYNLWKIMVKNFWHSDEVPLGNDKTKFKELSESEMRVFRKTISFLNFLDSLQTDNLPNLIEFVDAWEIRDIMTLQANQETVHAESYSKILMSICEPEVIDDIFNEWRNDPLLKERNVMVSDIYQHFADEPTLENFIRACMGNYNLESIFFWSGFTFFNLMARNGKMLQTNQMIQLIKKDELTHVVFFQNILKELQKEHPHIFTFEFIEELRQMMAEAVRWEVKWGSNIMDDQIEGITNNAIEQYIKWLSNDRLKKIGFEPLYPEVVDNPIKWIDQFNDFNNTREDFFESATVTNYQQPTNDMGWEEL